MLYILEGSESFLQGFFWNHVMRHYVITSLSFKKNALLDSSHYFEKLSILRYSVFSGNSHYFNELVQRDINYFDKNKFFCDTKSTFCENCHYLRILSQYFKKKSIFWGTKSICWHTAARKKTGNSLYSTSQDRTCWSVQFFELDELMNNLYCLIGELLEGWLGQRISA